MISQDATEAERAAAIARLGLDKSLPEQYLSFLSNLLQGDLGRSFVFGEPALQLVLDRFPATMELALCAMLISIFIGVPLGLYAGLRPDGFAGRSIMTGSIFGFSLPNFWQGLMLIMVFAVILQWLPAGRHDHPTSSSRATRIHSD